MEADNKGKSGGRCWGLAWQVERLRVLARQVGNAEELVRAAGDVESVGKLGRGWGQGLYITEFYVKLSKNYVF